MERGCAWVACIPWVLLVAAAVGCHLPTLSGEDSHFHSSYSLGIGDEDDWGINQPKCSFPGGASGLRSTPAVWLGVS